MPAFAPSPGLWLCKNGWSLYIQFYAKVLIHPSFLSILLVGKNSLKKMRDGSTLYAQYIYLNYVRKLTFYIKHFYCTITIFYALHSFSLFSFHFIVFCSVFFLQCNDIFYHCSPLWKRWHIQLMRHKRLWHQNSLTHSLHSSQSLLG